MADARRTISVMTPCYNEEGNVEALAKAVREVFDQLPGYEREHLFIDNASTDGTLDKLRTLAAEDPCIKVIANMRNFGHIRSPMHGLLQTTGDATILLVADFQDPPEMIVRFVRRWEEGYPLVLGIKAGADESAVMYTLRRAYYRVVTRLAEVELIENFTGFGLYDRAVLDAIRDIDDPYPYLRGLITELGFPHLKVPYRQPLRRSGITKNNFYTLYDMAMLGFTSHTKVPLRLATMTGFAVAVASLAVAMFYLVYKLVRWQDFEVGMAPVAIGLFFFSSVQLVFIGILGEYIAAIHTQVLKRPLVVEKERINL